MYSNSIWSRSEPDIWAEGYPIGNGRLGAMILGTVNGERIALNHDRLWRRYWTYKDRHLHDIFPVYQELCLAHKWEQAIELLRPRVIEQGKDIYVNPFVPVGDVGIYSGKYTDAAISDYRRELDISNALVAVSYRAGGIDFRREYVASWPAGVIAVNMSANQPSSIDSEISLYRLLDNDCTVSGHACDNELVLEGQFTEGVTFAAAIRVINSGGNMKAGLEEYLPPQAPSAETHEDLPFGFRELSHPFAPCGISTTVESADEVTLLIAMATDRVTDQSPVDFCRRRLDTLASYDYQALKDAHIEDYHRLYNRVSFRLGEIAKEDMSTPDLVAHARTNKQADPAVFERMFNLGRYLGIAAGRPARPEEAPKMPINLQGLWNEDPRPAWDSDFHLDLNLQMCYWGLGMVNLSETGDSLVDWAWRLLPQARHAAEDMCGLQGALYTCVCDAEHLGNFDDLFMLATGTNAWLAQSLWQVWEYKHDLVQLREKIYPIVLAIGEFYEGFLREDLQGQFVTAPSSSPENMPSGRVIGTSLSAMSTFDIELLRELFANLVTALTLLDVDAGKRELWMNILHKLPMPTINEGGRLLEWLDEDYQTIDPGHRHRSHLVGICPGQRITTEDTPDYADAVVKALDARLSHGGEGSCSLDLALDAQVYARLYRSAEALDKLNDMVANHAMDNLMLCLCDWRPESGLRWFGERRVFQIEASFGVMASMTEMIIQDRRGLIRILPALPTEWPDGDVKGIRCRGGFEASIQWRNGTLQQAVITSLRGNTCRMKFFDGIQSVQCHTDAATETMTCHRGIIEFSTSVGDVRAITPNN